MEKPLAASKKVMQNYLSELLTEEVDSTDTDIKPLTTSVKDRKLAKLLQNVSADVETEVRTKKSLASTETIVPPVIVTSPEEDDFAEEIVEEVSLQTLKSKDTIKAVKAYRQGDFQAMFFDVAGLTIAVPLIELGGIHQVDKITSLMGKPNWFKGVMLHRDEKINIVDTALWVMPEKCDETLINSLNYQYIIMLNDSSWGLSAEALVDTVTLSQDDVKWLDSPGKRPWLAGLVKNRMCALLNVDELVKLLDDGCGIIE